MANLKLNGNKDFIGYLYEGRFETFCYRHKTPLFNNTICSRLQLHLYIFISTQSFSEIFDTRDNEFVCRYVIVY